MDTKTKVKVNFIIRETLNEFLFELNTEQKRSELGYAIIKKFSLNDVNIENGLNLHTSDERVAEGKVDIRVDDELFPLKLEIVKSDVKFLQERFVTGMLSEEEEIAFLQFLVDNDIEVDFNLKKLLVDLIGKGVVKSKDVWMSANVGSIEDATNVTYILGADAQKGDIFVYNLIRKTNKGLEIILSKRMTDKDEFKKEVNNLAKYFNASLSWQVDTALEI